MGKLAAQFRDLASSRCKTSVTIAAGDVLKDEVISGRLMHMLRDKFPVDPQV